MPLQLLVKNSSLAELRYKVTWEALPSLVSQEHIKTQNVTQGDEKQAATLEVYAHPSVLHSRCSKRLKVALTAALPKPFCFRVSLMPDGRGAGNAGHTEKGREITYKESPTDTLGRQAVAQTNSSSAIHPKEKIKMRHLAKPHVAGSLPAAFLSGCLSLPSPLALVLSPLWFVPPTGWLLTLSRHERPGSASVL